MFGFAIWDGKRLFAARDRFGIKPFYYAVVDGVFYFASEVKALLPILPDIATNSDALAEYLTFQYTIGDRNLFKHVHILLPGHALIIENGSVRTFRYWIPDSEVDHDHDPAWFIDRMNEILDGSIALHLRSDVSDRGLCIGRLRLQPDRYARVAWAQIMQAGLSWQIHRLSRLRRERVCRNRRG